jgi:hypothetical protein
MTGYRNQAAKIAVLKAALEAHDKRDRTAPYEEQFKLWEALWEACDFSWEGLKDAGWEWGTEASSAQNLKRWDDRGTQRTLQDYWRWLSLPGEPASDAELKAQGLLVEREGRWWHVLHRPETVVDEGCTQLIAAIRAGLEAADSEQASATPLLLTGVRARGIDRTLREWASDHRALVLQAPFAELDCWNVKQMRFGKRTNFQRTTFGKRANFRAATFGDGASFMDATLGCEADFMSATFGDGTFFLKTTFGERAVFRMATFGHTTVFNDATFGAFAHFSFATFGNAAIFLSARFEDAASFSGATFGKGANFSSPDYSSDGPFWVGERSLTC